MTLAREFFREKVEDYDRLHYKDERSFMSERLASMVGVIDRLKLPPTARVLEAGCGPGRLLAALATRGFDTYAIDTSPQMLQLTSARLRQLVPPRRAGLSVAELEKLPFPNQFFDLVCTAGVVEYLPGDESAIRELMRVLRPGGFLVYPITNASSPVLWFDGLVEALKRKPMLLDTFNWFWTRMGRVPVRPRHFRVRTQSPAKTKTLVTRLGLSIAHEEYFYYLPVPHPFDRVFPGASAAIGRRMTWLARTAAAGVAEGYLIVAKRTGAD
jgi:SAM-dependent methyltransferase